MNVFHAAQSHETLDYSPLDGELLVEVTHWVPIAPTPGQFFIRTASLRLLLNYVQTVGFRTTLDKVRSRSREKLRNDKWCSLGFGAASLPGGGGRTLSPVVFFAPNHPPGLDRVPLPPAFVLESELLSAATPAQVCVFAPQDELRESALMALAGYSPHSGDAVDEIAARDALRRLEPCLADLVSRSEPVASMPRTALRLSVPARRQAASSRPRATLLGYGNFAKSVIIPSVRKLVQIDRIHDIDPTQLHRAPSANIAYSSAPEIDPGDSARLFFIATHHHVHTALALQAMQRGACAVVEKPLATTKEQMASLEQAVADGGTLVSGFQRRYSRLTRYAMEDLRASEAGAIDCAALIYQVPLPEGHWYEWPNSRSRLISNGCHWVDLFLYVNGYEACVDHHAQGLPNGDFYAYCRLENGAQMQMRLTERGSHRLGVRDHVQLTNRIATATIIDDASYQCESTQQVLRKARQNKIDSYRATYRHACDVALGAKEGDRIETLRSSWLSLELDAAAAPATPNLELLPGAHSA